MTSTVATEPAASQRPAVDERSSSTMPRQIFGSTAWLFYAVFVFEILFMISPAALHFYAAFGPVLNLLHASAATAWLTQFFLPHVSTSSSTILNASRSAGFSLIAAGLGCFVAGALPIYWCKLRGGGPFVGGLYRLVRHPQYLGLAVMGAGAVLVWPRFIVLLSYVTMLALYGLLAQWEEECCLSRFGDSYRAYRAATGRFLPRQVTGWLAWRRPTRRWVRWATAGAGYVAALSLALLVARAARSYTLDCLHAVYERDHVLLSPAPLTETELNRSRVLAEREASVRSAVAEAGAAKQIVYVLPETWRLADLPLEAQHVPGGHYTPKDFARKRFKVLFAAVRTHEPQATGRRILSSAYGLRPLIIAHVDLERAQVTSVETPPPHVRWGDIPTPLF
jgi:protein-S-isoprenylcysteine O-methyltransferase Ste14